MSAKTPNDEDIPMTEEEQEALGEAIVGTVVSLILAGFWLYLFAVHIYTTIIAFHTSGIAASIVSFLAPGFSEVYWFFRTGSETGYSSFYCVLLIIGFFLNALRGLVYLAMNIGKLSEE